MINRSQAFGEDELRRVLTRQLFSKYPELSEELTQNEVIKRAVLRANKLFDSTTKPTKGMANGKPAYLTNSTEEELVLRRCSENIVSAFNIRQKPRHEIIRPLASVLAEQSNYRVYKLDIKNFFEKIRHAALSEALSTSKYLSAQTIRLVMSYLDEFAANGVGLPRGVCISSPLSEVLLQRLDSALVRNANVIFCSRYVDDIIIITNCQEERSDFLAYIRTLLPKGLRLNNLESKQKIVDVHVDNKTKSTCSENEFSLNYLGYELAISMNKVRKTKTKLAKAFYSYKKSLDYGLLLDRVRFLTSNRYIMNKTKNRRIATGVYYGSPLLSPDSKRLEELDKFLYHLIHGSKGRRAGGANGTLTGENRKELSRNLFTTGFSSKRKITYSPNRSREITVIWR
jgi:hypothetical protein